MTSGADQQAGPEDTLDAFHRGRFHLLQPKRGGHRAGMDAMMLAALVAADDPADDRADDPFPGGRLRIADLGAGAGAAGLGVAARIESAEVTLVERSALMAEFARRTLFLPQNAALAGRVSVVEADVTLRGAARQAAGLPDDHFHHVIMNPPFNDGRDRQTPDRLKAEAHAMTEDLLEAWIRTAGAIMVPGGQLSLIARPSSVAEIIAACGRRFGGIELTALHPRPGEDAIRLLVTAIKGSRARLVLRAPLFMHDSEGHAFTPLVDDLNNGRQAYRRRR
ncbi:tRNA1(Val) (adenine(37)-N6)-methyltransferase [Rhizobium sp. SSA_523]|uniref:tRNA1(Val) (adenine(37)-N6)-methyltransferase n=1 Tax=Rhizobium sp. SSA_523 TaxID=2952477 RepID=UPI002090DF0F|nr:methyltransferase [Rhizobium sp. SSA_523]MCO5731109.1 methyltransferase [Rhizobium sp. SSA_523]WKC24093.1 methyltransferase [Rhizobium sp. SSA_523]